MTLYSSKPCRHHPEVEVRSRCGTCPVCNRNRASAWKRENPAKHLITRASVRAKASEMEFSITTDDVVVPEFCPILGIKLAVGGNKDSSPSIDRIDNGRGYVKGNVIVISQRANRIKSDATADELRLIADFYALI